MSGKRRRRKFLFPAVFVLILVLALAGVRMVLTALYPLQYEELIDRYSEKTDFLPHSSTVYPYRKQVSGRRRLTDRSAGTDADHRGNL